MVFVEGYAGKILYTGDCRAEPNFIQNFDNDIFKNLKNLYIDTSFCHKSYKNFPLKSESVEHLINFVEKKPKTSRFLLHMINLGYEELIIGLFEEFKEKVFVSKERYALYRQIPLLKDIITTSNEVCSRFHCCDWCNNCKSLDKQKDGKFFSLKPVCRNWDYSSIMDNDESVNNTALILHAGGNRYSICIAMHSSLSELQKFVSLLQPGNIVANVVRETDLPNKDIMKLLSSFTTIKKRETAKTLEETSGQFLTSDRRKEKEENINYKQLEIEKLLDLEFQNVIIGNGLDKTSSGFISSSERKRKLSIHSDVDTEIMDIVDTTKKNLEPKITDEQEIHFDVDNVIDILKKVERPLMKDYLSSSSVVNTKLNDFIVCSEKKNGADYAIDSVSREKLRKSYQTEELVSEKGTETLKKKLSNNKKVTDLNLIQKVDSKIVQYFENKFKDKTLNFEKNFVNLTY
ncbi:Protein artemis [Clydaea vesicula]|uniref:Protein artemis n=1 Tax=Clydaea vesicula TaxID=447962 RepID=A0AAD5XV14_9FUNG|nr:Protein artemis [Clydaea vesicula]